MALDLLLHVLVLHHVMQFRNFYLVFLSVSQCQGISLRSDYICLLRTVAVYDRPEETCNLQSFRSCQPVTKLVPHLKDKDECVGGF